MKTTTESMLCSLCHGPLQSTTDTAAARSRCVCEWCVCVGERENKKDNKQCVVLCCAVLCCVVLCCVVLCCVVLCCE